MIYITKTKELTALEDKVVQKKVVQDKGVEADYGYLPDLIGHLVSLINLKSTNLCIQNLSDLNMTTKQAVTLHYISRNDDTMQKDLATGVGTSPTVMVGILDGLELEGYIRRVPSKKDRRSSTVVLTPEGQKVLPKVKEAFFATETQLDQSAKLSPAERQSLLKLLRKLAGRELKL